VPKEARWSHLKAKAPQPTIGTIVDDAMSAIERDNPSLKGVLPKDYARPGLDKQRLGQLINLVSDIGLGSPADRAKDILGRVCEYFLAQFASAEGKEGGQFYTPSRVVRVLVEMLAPYKGRVYDPCCGSGGMFVSGEKFIEAHSGKLGDISLRTHDLASLDAYSAVPGLNRNLAYVSGPVVPHPPLRTKFDKLARAFLRRVNHAKNEIRALTALCDTLLPKLISGELRVTDAERFMERAV
jgi:hypothetical protein